MRKLFAVAVLAVVGGLQAETLPGIWVGSFDGPGLWGGLELTLDQQAGQWAAQARLQVNGRLHSEPVDQLLISDSTIGFRTMWEGREVRVTGSVTGSRLRGSVEMTGSAPDQFMNGQLDLVRLSTSSSDTLPPPTGSLAIGRTAFIWVDRGGDETAINDSPGKRELMVYLWYPTEHRGHSPYLVHAEKVAPFLPKGTLEINTKLELAVSDNAPMLKGRRYPIVFFSPGNGVNAFHYSSLCEDLASHGFVVAAVDDPYDAPVIVFPDGRTVVPKRGPAQKGSDLDLQRQAADLRARDILSVKKAIGRMNADPNGMFAGSFDLSKLFVVGHSLGGMAAFRACQLQPSILACVNIDGSYRARPYPAAVADSVIEPAFLWLRRPLYEFTDTQLKQIGMTRAEFDEEIAMGNRVMRSVGKGGFDVRLPHAGIDHMDFTDLPLLQSDISPSSRATRLLTIEMMRSWVRDFLAAAGDGQPGRILTQTSAAYREARITAYR